MTMVPALGPGPDEDSDQAANVRKLHAFVVPEVEPDADALTVALSFAKRGGYVGPASSGNAKHPGSRLGKGWPTKTSTDEPTVVAWFAGTSDAPFLHCGRSGLVALDVDDPNLVPEPIARVIAELNPPFQATRPDEDPRRGHYLFEMPPGRRIGNGSGGLGTAWGDVRGANGVIALGGRRRWLVTGPVPVLPAELADRFGDVGDAAATLSDTEVKRFVDTYTVAARPDLLATPVSGFTTAVERGGNRHPTALSAACWIVRDAIKGYYAAKDGLGALRDVFVTAMTEPGTDRVLTTRQAKAEFGSIEAWAVAQEWRPDAVPPAEPGEADPTEALRDILRRSQVDAEVERKRVKAEADRLYAAELRAAEPPAAITCLSDLLAEPEVEQQWLAEGIWPAGGKVVLAAPQKAGKTTTVNNVLRALADGDPILGPRSEGLVVPFGEETSFRTADLGEDERIFVADFELTRDMWRRWMADQKLQRPDRVVVEFFRGRTWDIRDKALRKVWAEILRTERVRVLIIDPLAPVLAGLGIDENDNLGVLGYLQALDALVFESGASELLVVHHTGHGAERSRGASGLRGWPDVEWRIVREETPDGREPEAGAARFFAAEGRDVGVRETRLEFDPSTRTLTLTAGNRAQHARTKYAAPLLELVRANEGVVGRSLESLAGDAGIGQSAFRTTRAALLSGCQIHLHRVGKAERHYLGERCSTCPET